MLGEVSVKMVELIGSFLVISAFIYLVVHSYRWYRKMKNVGSVLIGKGEVAVEAPAFGIGANKESKEEYKKKGFVDVVEFFKHFIIGFMLASIGSILTVLLPYL